MSTNVTETLQGLRERYCQSSLDVSDCAKNPADQMASWLQDAINGKCDEPNAFVLSTCENNKPHGRVVLLKGLLQDKLYFYTNYQSAKGSEISANASVAMTFLWLPLQRQVRIEGKIALASAAESDEYFSKRPRGSQIGAIASPQSSRVSDRTQLEKWFRDTEEKFKGQENLPRPANWGGYTITPDYFEFWQGRDNRMHDRISYKSVNGNWEMFRLAP
ncbi:MAG: pyridoxamine 5'-phosphate oxidase [Bdellovibrionota bacterium]